MSATLQVQNGPPDVRVIRSRGGIEAWQVESDFVPLVALAFCFEGGAAQDPPGKAGTAQLLARLLDEGAGTLRSDAFQERLAERAIELTFTAGPDAIGGSLKSLVEHSDEAFELLRLALAEPRFDDDAIERVRAQTVAGLRYQQNDPGTVASKRFLAEAFPDHPYGHPASGTPETVAAITRQDIVDLHRRVIAAGRLKVAIVGAGIDVTRVEPEGGTAQTLLPGTVAVPPRQLRIVAAPAAGLVESVLVAPNEPVRAGQTLALLRSTDLLEAQRSYLQALSGEELARQRLVRDEQMYRERIIAERRLLTTRADHDFARTTLQEREQMMALLGMAEPDIKALRETRKMAAALVVTAPEDGVVLETRTSAGERVAASAPLFSIARLKPLWVNLQVPLPQAMVIEPGTRASIPGTTAQGEVVRLGRSVDPATQAVTAVLEVDDGAEGLRPGQVVTASVALRPNGSPEWRVPAGAVVRHAGRSWVFVRTRDGFRAKPVTVISETASATSIRAGLAPDDRVVTRGILALLGELTDIYGG